jgi:hypothetical protein
MSTLQSLPVSVYVSAALVAGLVACIHLLIRLSEKRKKAKENAEISKFMEKNDKEGLALFEKGRYSAAEQRFEDAVAQAVQIGDRNAELRYQHQLCLAMSRTGCYNSWKATQKLKKLVEEMRRELFSNDPMLQLAQENLEKLESVELKLAIQADFDKAGRHFEKGNLPEANYLYIQCYRAAKAMDDQLWCAKVLMAHSRISASNGQKQEAVQSLEKALRLAREHGGTEEGLTALIEWNLGAYQILREEEAVKELLSKTRAAYGKRELDEAMELADQALALASEKLKGDHWLNADALNLRACVNLSKGFYSAAREDLDYARQILSEWPEAAAHLSEAIESNLARCKRDMGY